MVHIDADEVACLRGRPARPGLVDEQIGGHGLARVQEQRRQDRPLLGSPDPFPVLAGPGLKRAQHPEETLTGWVNHGSIVTQLPPAMLVFSHREKKEADEAGIARDLRGGGVRSEPGSARPTGRASLGHPIRHQTTRCRGPRSSGSRWPLPPRLPGRGSGHRQALQHIANETTTRELPPTESQPSVGGFYCLGDGRGGTQPPAGRPRGHPPVTVRSALRRGWSPTRR